MDSEKQNKTKQVLIDLKKGRKLRERKVKETEKTEKKETVSQIETYDTVLEKNPNT